MKSASTRLARAVEPVHNLYVAQDLSQINFHLSA